MKSSCACQSLYHLPLPAFFILSLPFPFLCLLSLLSALSLSHPLPLPPSGMWYRKAEQEDRKKTTGSTTEKQKILKASSFAVQAAKLEAQILEHKKPQTTEPLAQRKNNSCEKLSTKLEAHITAQTANHPAQAIPQTGNPKVVCASVCAFHFMKSTNQNTKNTNQSTNWKHTQIRPQTANHPAQTKPQKTLLDEHKKSPNSETPAQQKHNWN